MPSINIMRTKLGEPRKTKEIFDTFETTEVACQNLVRALHEADPGNWYFWEEKGKTVAPEDKPAFWARTPMNSGEALSGDGSVGRTRGKWQYS